MSNGTGILAAYPFAKVRIECRHCERRAKYDRDALIKRVGGEIVLPTLLLMISEGLDCDLARRNQTGDSTAGMEQCGLIYPDRVARWRGA
jgi:hypothetical protein